MKLIKLSTNDEVSVHEFPTGNHGEQNEALRELIGSECRTYEHVMPRRLYTLLGMVPRSTKMKGQCVSMLVDEEFMVRQTEQLNFVASYLYETDIHQAPILGNVLFVGEEWVEDGIDFCGIEEAVFEDLLEKLTNMANAMKARKETLE